VAFRNLEEFFFRFRREVVTSNLNKGDVCRFKRDAVVRQTPTFHLGARFDELLQVEASRAPTSRACLTPGNPRVLWFPPRLFPPWLWFPPPDRGERQRVIGRRRRSGGRSRRLWLFELQGARLSRGAREPVESLLQPGVTVAVFDGSRCFLLQRLAVLQHVKVLAVVGLFDGVAQLLEDSY